MSQFRWDLLEINLYTEKDIVHVLWLLKRQKVKKIDYVLVNQLRATALKGSELANSYCGTIRSKLLKIGAVVVRNTRSIKVSLSSCHPFKELFIQAASRLQAMTG